MTPKDCGMLINSLCTKDPDSLPLTLLVYHPNSAQWYNDQMIPFLTNADSPDNLRPLSEPASDDKKSATKQ